MKNRLSTIALSVQLGLIQHHAEALALVSGPGNEIATEVGIPVVGLQTLFKEFLTMLACVPDIVSEPELHPPLAILAKMGEGDATVGAVFERVEVSFTQRLDERCFVVHVCIMRQRVD